MAKVTGPRFRVDVIPGVSYTHKYFFGQRSSVKDFVRTNCVGKSIRVFERTARIGYLCIYEGTPEEGWNEI